MSKNYLDDGGLQVPSKAESLEHAQISGVHGKKVFPIDLPPTAQTNSSVSITESTIGTVTTTTIQKTIDSDVYQQTIREDSSDNSVTVSIWSKL